MNVSEVANLIGTSPDSLRRWSNEYSAFLSPGATPGKGLPRDFNDHDLRVLNFVAIARENYTSHDDIRAQLGKWQAGGWAELPDIPKEWKNRTTGTITVAEAGERAEHIAEITALQAHVTNLRQNLEQAQQRVDQLQAELSHLRGSERATMGELNDLKVDLATARGEVATLRAQLGQYALGGDVPLPIGAILMRAAVWTAALVLAVLVAGAALAVVLGALG